MSHPNTLPRSTALVPAFSFTWGGSIETVQAASLSEAAQQVCDLMGATTYRVERAPEGGQRAVILGGELARRTLSTVTQDGPHVEDVYGAGRCPFVPEGYETVQCGRPAWHADGGHGDYRERAAA